MQHTCFYYWMVAARLLCLLVIDAIGCHPSSIWWQNIFNDDDGSGRLRRGSWQSSATCAHAASSPTRGSWAQVWMTPLAFQTSDRFAPNTRTPQTTMGRGGRGHVSSVFTIKSISRGGCSDCIFTGHANMLDSDTSLIVFSIICVLIVLRCQVLACESNHT